MLAVWRKVRWSIRHRGVGGTLRVLVSTFAGGRKREPERVHPFDEAHGTDTGGLIGGGTLAVGSVHDVYIVAYAGIAPSRLRAGLQRWSAALMSGETIEDFSFVDLGCGKGRALLLASEYPFRKVAGVELNPTLAARAEVNVQSWVAGGRGLVRPQVMCADATAFQYPEGGLLVFIYNAFGDPVIVAVMDALERHVAATGARVDLLFQNEGPETPLRTDRRLALLWRGSLPMSAEDAAAELVGSAEDVTSLYRWVG